MKHIKLFEEISSELPKVFTREEIKNMTQEEFFEVMEMYYKEHNSAQAFTLLQIWVDSHPELSVNPPVNSDFYIKLGKYANFIDTEHTDDGPLSRGRQISGFSKENSKASAKYDLTKKISDLEQHIKQREELIIRNKEKLAKEVKADEELIRMFKEKLENLNFELTRTM